MKTIFEMTRKSSPIELALFAGVLCLALTAGYASLTSKATVQYGDITGSAHAVKKVTPLATMQAMPEMVPADH